MVRGMGNHFRHGTELNMVVVGGGGWGMGGRGNHFRHGEGKVEFQTWSGRGGIISDMVRGRWNHFRHGEGELECQTARGRWNHFRHGEGEVESFET